MTDELELIWNKLSTNGFKVSTDTRKEIAGTIFFALKGENFDGSTFVKNALDRGVAAVVTQNQAFKALERVYVVDDSLKTLQEMARRYRESFNVPIIAIGGSNGKTTTRELIRCVLETKYKTHATQSNLNNEIGLPLSILSMEKDTEIGLFEIGANHPNEHTALLQILNPTHVLVTNSGMDHLEGFGSPIGVKEANEEINIWAREHKAMILISKPLKNLTVINSLPLRISIEGKEFNTKMAGKYNSENIYRALSVGENFDINQEEALEAISKYNPEALRSQLVEKDGMHIVLDCYNANPSSMMLALESFVEAAGAPRGIFLGDMLELGSYADEEHIKVLQYISKQKFDVIVIVGEKFREAKEALNLNYTWFPNSLVTQEWCQKQNFKNFTLLLKGSRGMQMEKILFVQES